jgi:hypothetical protein
LRQADRLRRPRIIEIVVHKPVDLLTANAAGAVLKQEPPVRRRKSQSQHLLSSAHALLRLRLKVRLVEVIRDHRDGLVVVAQGHNRKLPRFRRRLSSSSGNVRRQVRSPYARRRANSSSSTAANPASLKEVVIGTNPAQSQDPFVND